MRNWGKRARCRNCKKIVNANYKFADRFFMPICPECGADNDVEPVTARFVYKGIWYKPWTWLDEEWEIKE